ncbi:peptidylprolyl isomerase [Lacticaseibacillus absianus]|uniref:peptidylprolyl isomerase n=1 Tax=Lacticaseibacillus absianus TaxID=2729623 RepID=UPI0015CABB1E|nr:peptidylprolyl isomerase [Lacticaseibacillus absianus]
MKFGFTKPLLLAALTVGLTTAAGCSSTPAQTTDPVIATYKGHKLTEDQFYQELKSMPNNQAALANLLLYRALDQAYGDQVAKKTVDKSYTSYKQQYGSQFTAFLSQNNLTPSLFRRSLRLQLLGEAALKALRPVSQTQLEAAWKTYKPTLEVQHIQTTDEATAQTVISALNAGQDFKALASQYSVDTATKDKGGVRTVTATDKTLDSTFKDAAYGLKVGAYTTTPVKVTDGYEVIKLIKDPGKGTLSQHKAELKASIYNTWLKDTSVMRNVFSKVLKAQDVTIKDKDLQSALSLYLSDTDDAQ